MKKTNKNKLPSFDEIIKYDSTGRKLQSDAIFKCLSKAKLLFKTVFKRSFKNGK